MTPPPVLSRLFWSLFTTSIFLLGWFSRKTPMVKIAPSFVGDACYALLIYGIVKLIRPALSPKLSFYLALSWCTAMELIHVIPNFSKVVLSNYPIAKWVIGQGFQWSDLGIYCFSLLFLAFVDFHFFAKKHK